MYTENRGKDIFLFCKACLSNQLAHFFPKLYVNLTQQTGRGEKTISAFELANYFIQCFDDYLVQLNINKSQSVTYLNNKTILEYGPGDILAVALLFYAHGAKYVHCVDKFPLSKMSKTNLNVYQQLIDRLDEQQRKRAESAFNITGKPQSGFKETIINYQVTPHGLSGKHNQYDLIISRAVLEHVNDLNKTMLDIKQSLKRQGISLHQVDLKSHGLDRYTAFDFLTWPKNLYQLMYSHKGFPNRWRINKYKELAISCNLDIKKIFPIYQLEQIKITKIQQKLSQEFRNLSTEELSWQVFWICLTHPNQETLK